MNKPASEITADDLRADIMNAHTHGPWCIHRAYTDISGMAVECENGDAFVAWSTYVGSGDKLVCEVIARTGEHGWPTVQNKHELVANARLIAAVPELLAVARMIVSFARNTRENAESTNLLYSAADAARAAIAKATSSTT